MNRYTQDNRYGEQSNGANVKQTLFHYSNRRLVLGSYVLAFFLVSWLTFGSLRHLLLEVDDATPFRDNLAISVNFEYFFQPEKKTLGSGRPVAELVKLTVFTLWGNNPAAFHLTVVVLHTLASLLLTVTTYRLGANIELSLLSGALMLVNVTHFRAVQWISAMDYPLALAFALCALICYQQKQHCPGVVWQLGFYICYGLGLLSHVAVIVVWPLCVHLSWVSRIGSGLRHHLLLGAISVMAIVGAFTYTAKSTTTWSALREHSFATLISGTVDMAEAILWLAGRLVSTAHWLAFPVHLKQSWEPALGAAALLFVEWLVIKRNSVVSSWSFFTIISLSLPTRSSPLQNVPGMNPRRGPGVR